MVDTDKLGPYELNQIYTGDARQLAKAIPDESVDLIFTDPVYQNVADYEWLAETAARVLRANTNLLCYCAHTNLPEILAALSQHLTYRWILIQRKLGPQSRMWDYHVFGTYIPLLWFSKDKGFPVRWIRDTVSISPHGEAVNHAWTKNYEGVSHWLARFTEVGAIVVDPFCGGGAILGSCKQLRRQYLGFEIDPNTTEIARRRVAQTQPPLFVEQPEQLTMREVLGLPKLNGQTKLGIP